MTYIETLGAKAKAAEHAAASASAKLKNEALKSIADALIQNTGLIIEKNKLDLENAVKNGMSVSMQDRLMLNEKRISDIASSVLKLIEAEDLIGSVDYGVIRPNGLKICKTRVPLGVIGIIFESRPNVTVDAATLCLKAGNTVILKGGKEAINSNKCLADVMRAAVEKAGLPADVIQLVEDTSREAAAELMKLNKYLDVLIPRGGAGLINAVVNQATVPVIETGTGNCHVYVDESADIQMAADIVNNGKTQRPSVCNAVESLLVHKNIAEAALPVIKSKLDEHNVEIRGCQKTADILGDCVTLASDDDYATEFLDFIISVKVVDSIEEAIEHIQKYSTRHSECIVTKSLENAEKFQREVDAAAVYVNASTRFTDGGEFGFGAEIGISTQKLHARGPMGLRELTTVKYLINGNGQIR
ncbi:MAG: glutamate-5-semialdehyde dehydrogenase [Oscillospiraceae bacterium]|nr:glutamate-5-semialdehyde dehydrogenase [Oscillospiraceae bacterium]OLA69709.1 MAG: glutamate-5-semialdehyde dehydrogenase [Ruminococcus sp. 37_24]